MACSFRSRQPVECPSPGRATRMRMVSLPGALTAMPSAMVWPEQGSASPLIRVEHGGKDARLHAVNVDTGFQRLGRDGKCPRSIRRRRSAPPACRSRARRPAFRAPPSPGRPSPWDRHRVDEDQILFHRDLLGAHEGFRQRRPFQNDPRAETSGVLDLVERGEL